jgi:prepilin-type processing-associated H-X9-DG protein
MSNLRSIGQAMYQYATENKGNFPRGYWLPDSPTFAPAPNFDYSSASDHTWNALRGFTDPAATDPFNNAQVWNGDNVLPPWVPSERPGDNDVTGALFLLLRTYKMPAKTFICPSCDSYYPDNFGGLTSQDRSNFSSPYNLGYSVSIPFPKDSASAKAINYVWGTSADPQFALMADLNPGESLNGANGPSCVVSVSGLYGGTGPQTPMDPPSIQRKANSNNHFKAGQNVLYADGHCEWRINAFAGAYQDNIYTAQGDPSATSGTNNIWTGVDQLPLNGTRLPYRGTDSMMQPSQSAWQIGTGIGIE